MINSDKVLIRLKDTHNENNMLSTFYTTKPVEFLALFKYCQEHEIPLKKNSIENIEGDIEDIDIFFGGGENCTCIDVWINKW